LLPSSRRDPRGEDGFRARRPEHRVGRGIPACKPRTSLGARWK
jgi:hypothetical protein